MDSSQQELPDLHLETQALLSTHPQAPELLKPELRVDEYFEHQGYQPSSVNISITKQFETPEEIQFRHKQAIDERHHQRQKEYLGYGLGIILISVLATTSIVFLCNKNTSQESQGWARTTLTSVITAVAGYVFGSKGSEKK